MKKWIRGRVVAAAAWLGYHGWCRGHCLTCCPCEICHADWARAVRLGIPVGNRRPR